MAPLVPRMDVFEIADFDWFPNFLRAYFQAALTAAWTTYVPYLHRISPARLVAHLLQSHLPPPLSSYTIIDFCAGGGGPSPSIERYLNPSPSPSPYPGQEPQDEKEKGKVHVVLTDLHPHPTLWQDAAAQRPGGTLSFVPHPVDAANVAESLVEGFRDGGGEEGGKRKVFRMFCLAFHHFPDRLARRILKGAVEGAGVGEGFGIFELQDRTIYGFMSCCLFGLATLLLAPYYALVWGEPLALVFTYLIPILPTVLVFDGWMSCLRTRTPDEVKALLRTCGAEGGEDEIAKNWEIKSGTEVFLWPAGRVNWIIAVKKS